MEYENRKDIFAVLRRCEQSGVNVWVKNGNVITERVSGTAEIPPDLMHDLDQRH